MLAWSDNQGTTWANRAVTSDDLYVLGFPSMASNGSVAMVVWVDQGVIKTQICAVDTMAPIVTLTFNQTNGTGLTITPTLTQPPALSIGPNGWFILVVECNDTFAISPYYSVFDGSTWSELAPIVIGRYGLTAPAITYDGGETWMVAYLVQQGADLAADNDVFTSRALHFHDLNC